MPVGQMGAPVRAVLGSRLVVAGPLIVVVIPLIVVIVEVGVHVLGGDHPEIRFEPIQSAQPPRLPPDIPSERSRAAKVLVTVPIYGLGDTASSLTARLTAGHPEEQFRHAHRSIHAELRSQNRQSYRRTPPWHPG